MVNDSLRLKSSHAIIPADYDRVKSNYKKSRFLPELAGRGMGRAGRPKGNLEDPDFF